MKLPQAILTTIVLVLGVAVAVAVYFNLHLPPSADEVLEIGTTTEKVFYAQEAFADSSLRQEFLNAIDAEEALGNYLLVTSIQKRAGAEEPYDEAGKLFTPNTFVFEAGVVGIEYPFNYPLWFLNGEIDGERLFVTQPYDESGSVARLFNSAKTHDMVKVHETKDAESVTGIRFPKLSQSGKYYLYTANFGDPNTKPEEMLKDPKAWRIYVGAPDGSRQSFYFADGYSAVWAGKDEYIIYTRHDGIFGKKFRAGEKHETEPEFPLLSLYGEQGVRNELAISPDGQYLAVAYPFDSKVSDSFVEIYRLRLTEAEPLAELVERILYRDGQPLMSPVFSPGGRYLAMLVDDLDKGTNDDRLVVYDFVQQSFLWDIDFNDFYMASSFITDWVEKPKPQ